VKLTERSAAFIPLISMRSSGKLRRRRAMRAIRDNRSNRNILIIPMSGPDELPMATYTIIITHVSKTIKTTMNESKMNQASRRQFLLSSKAPNLMSNSIRK